jgi:hypothetical protein
MSSYRILENGSAIWCATCGYISFNQNDVAEHYCGMCKVFHDDEPYSIDGRDYDD